MNEQLPYQSKLFPTIEPKARSSDPDTSHDAADSVAKVAETQHAILAMLQQFGPATDQDIFLRLAEAGFRVAPSGARTRRKELQDMGLVEWSGVKRKLRSGRQSRVWALTDQAADEVYII